MIDLNPHHLDTVKRILAEHLPDCEVRAFGSRANWTAWEYSDLDLAVVSPEPLAWDRRSLLREAFEESDLPIRVDVVDWASLTDNFRQAIEGDCVVLQEPTLAGDWRQTTLGEVVEINPKRSLKRGDEAPFVAMADVLEHQRQLLEAGARKFKGGGSRFRNGDTLLARITPCLENGKTAWVSGLEDGEIGHGSTEFIVLSAREGTTDPLFVYYLSRHPHFREFAIGQMTGTSGRQRVPVPAIESYEFCLPPLDEQRRIARILGTLDDKIELNRRMSETLEAMAQALFKSWFVDFDPVRAKAEGRPTGLPPHLDALFPDSFQDSELGEIPEGWEVGQLGDIAKTVRGRSYRSAELAKSDTALVTLKSFARGGGYRPEGLKPYTGKYKPEQVIEPGELVIACTDVTQAAEVVGRPAVVLPDQRFTTLVASLDTMILRPLDIDAMPVSYLYGLTSSPAFTSHTYAHVTGTTVLHLQKDAAPEYRFPRPPKEVIEAFGNLASTTASRTAETAIESERLSLHRDALLPRLMSAEVTLSRSRPLES